MARRKANAQDSGTQVLELDVASAEVAQEVAASVPAHHSENPEKLSGEALKTLAHRNGISKSELANMDDEKIRRQLKVLAYRRHEENASI